MQNLITTTALLILLGTPGAIAQTAASARPSVGLASSSSSMTPDRRLIGSAPVGHRQPRATDVPSENPASGDLEQISPEDAALDRKINNICRGC